jgi:hypothetical protein
MAGGYLMDNQLDINFIIQELNTQVSNLNLEIVIAKARIKMLEEMIQKNEATKSQKASKKIDSGDF